MKSHLLINQRSRAFGRAIANRIADHPELIQQARVTLVRWMKTCSPRSHSTLKEWLEALDGPVEGVIVLLTSTDERATRLRQSNPFAGLLPPQERNAIIRQFYSYDAASA